MRKLDQHTRGSSYFPSNPSHGSTGPLVQQGSHVTSFSFPATKDVLWDRTPTGNSTILHITKYRNIGLHVLEKSVQLAYRHALQSEDRPYRCFLIGSVTTDKDEEGVTITVDRFDPGRDIPGRAGRMPTARLPGDQVIPLLVSVSMEDSPTTHSMDDFSTVFKLIEHGCSCRDTLDISNLLSFRIHCCCYDNTDDVTFNLHVGAVTMGSVLEATSINPVPIIPTALARNLKGPLSLSQLQGVPKIGYITMDQTRKLLLLLESDPKACTLPLIGIWVSGLSNLCSPLVWASCLRYMFNNSIHERVCTAEQGFLLVMFSPSRRQPVFYECRSLGGDDKPSYELVGCRENIHVYKHGEQTARSPVQLELTTARDGPNRALFMDALKQFIPNCLNPKSTPLQKPSRSPLPRSHSVTMAGEEAQTMPRPSPKPLLDKSPTVQPSVPELSILFDSFLDESQEVIIMPQSQDSLPNPMIPHQQQPQGFSTKQTLQPSSVNMQTGQENLSVPSGHGHHVGVDGHIMRSSHVDTPPGRPGPLRPVDANVVQTSVKIKQGSHHHLKEKQIFAKQAPGTGEIINRNVTSNRRSQQQPVANPSRTRGPVERKSLSNGSTALSKPPSSRKSDILQKTLPPSQNHRAASLTDKSVTPARRMSYPIPVSQKNRKNTSSNHQLPVPSGWTSQAGNVLRSESSRSSQAERQMIPNQHPSSGSSSRVSPRQVGQHAVQTGTNYSPLSPPSTPTESKHFAGVHATPEESKTQHTPSSNTPHAHSHPGPRFSSIPRSQSTASSHQQKISTVNPPSTAVPFQNQPSSPWDDKYPGNIAGVSEDSESNKSVKQRCLPHELSNTIIPHDQATRSSSGFKQHVKEQPIEYHGVQGQQQEQNRGEMDLGSNECMVQLRRQEQLIQNLQAQIQMLLAAQAAQTNHQLPAGLMSPPATPTSLNSASQPGVTPIPHPPSFPSQATPTNHIVATDISPAMSTPLHTVTPEVATPIPRPINPHPSNVKPSTHSIATDTACDTPPVKATCSMAVMTGKSLLWPDGTGSPVKLTKNQSTGITPHTSPARDPPQPALPNRNQNLTFDTEITFESNPDMTLPLQQTRDCTQSTVFDVSAVDLHSFAHDISRSNESSPARSPGWVSDNDRDPPHTTNPLRQPQEDPEMTQGSYPMDSLHSPVLGESASTCAPPGRRDTSDSDSSFERSDVNDGRGGSKEADDETDDPPASLLYRDKKKFYQHLLGNIEQMLTDQSMGLHHQGHHDADEIAMTTQEEVRHLGFNPETLLDRSVMYRSMCMLNSDFFPRINYVSLMDVDLDSPNLSYEANAIAMKYLTEEELIQLSAGFKGQGATPLSKVNPLLRSALTGVADLGMQTGSTSFSAVNLSMASRKYMEKYGLLESPEGKKPEQVRATDGTVETLGTGNVRIERKAESCARKQLLKTTKQITKHSVESNAAVSRKDGRDLIQDNEQHRVDRHIQSPKDRPKEVTPPKVRLGLISEKEPPQKPPRCFQDAQQRPPQTTAAPSRQRDTQMDTGPGGNTSPLGQHKKHGVKVAVGEKADGGKTSDRRNILDVQRLKQLPKLF